MTQSKKTRRGVLATGLGAIGAAVASPLSAAVPTASATEGPFYPTPPMRRPDVDNDLVKIMGTVQEAGGEVMILRGRITDTDGNPLAGRRIEIWQCDMNGKYLHPGDDQDITFDPAFQGFGHDVTGPEGDYVFRTIKPVPYPGRTPHIHVKVFDDSGEILTTQFYREDFPGNDRDRIYNRLSDSEAAAVTMVFTDGPDGPEATVDVVV